MPSSFWYEFIDVGFYFFVFAAISLLTNLNETSYNVPLNCEGNKCFASDIGLFFPSNDPVYIYLSNPYLSQASIAYQ